MRRLRSLLAVLFVLVLLPAAAPAEPGSPARVIEDLHQVLLKALQTTPPGRAGIDARYRLFDPVMGRAYDFGRMIEVATGTAWAGASDAEKQALTDAFARLSVMIYAERFGGGFAGERFEITGERPGPRDTRLVDTLIHRGTAQPLAPGEEPTVRVTYVLAERDGGWRIVDVLLDRSISELALRRSEYATVLREGGIARLIRVLNDKADATAAG
jgi:phospholipid transport system substrate-binding protein